MLISEPILPFCPFSRLNYLHEHTSYKHTNNHTTTSSRRIVPLKSPEVQDLLHGRRKEAHWTPSYFSQGFRCFHRSAAYIVSPLDYSERSTPPKWLRFCVWRNEENDWLYFGGDVVWCSNRDWQVSYISTASTAQWKWRMMKTDMKSAGVVPSSLVHERSRKVR